MLYNLNLRVHPRGGVGVRDTSRLRGSDKREVIHFDSLLPTRAELEALPTTQARRAYAYGCEQFGKRPWYLVRREEDFRAVEHLGDAPGWQLVAQVRRAGGEFIVAGGAFIEAGGAL